MSPMLRPLAAFLFGITCWTLTILGPMTAAHAVGAIALSAPNGYGGDFITVSSTAAFPPSVPVIVTYDGSPVGPATSTDGAGNFSLQFQVPLSPAGVGHPVQATAGGQSASQVFTILSRLSVSPTAGTSGTSMTFIGTGFGASAAIGILFSAVLETTFFADPNGSFSKPYPIPFRPAGAYAVAVQGTGLTQTLTINAGLGVSPSIGPPGTNVTVTGSGAAANSVVSLRVDSIDVRLVVSDSVGSYTTLLTIPPVAGGSHLVSVAGGASVPFTVTPLLKLDRLTSAPGSSITASGNGFGANEGNISITIDNKPEQSSITADSTGTWSKTFNVPSLGAGAHIVKASGTLTTEVSVPSLTLSISAGVQLDRASGSPGTQVKVSGFGFTANSSIAVTPGNSQTVNATVDSQGTWSASITIPPAPSGSLGINVMGTGTAPVVATFTVSPAIAVSPANTTPGASVTVKGSGFPASLANIALTLGNAMTTVSSDPSGSWTTPMTVPQTAGGQYTLRSGGSAPEVSAPLNIGAGITLSASTGTPGDRVTITGSGFSANQRGISVNFGQTSLGSTDPNADGSWSLPATIPASPTGSYSIRTGGGGPVVDAPFGVTPAIAMNPTNVTPGTSVTVSGNGFGASEKGIVIRIGQQTFDGGSADAQGSWTKTITTPPLAAGTYNISASGSFSNTTTVRAATFLIGAGLSAIPSKGSPEAAIRLAGSGFKAGEQNITLTFEGLPLPSVNADANGAFISMVTIPVLPGGSHELRAASTETTTTAVLKFQITPTILLRQASGAPGSPVTIAGSGYGPEEAGISLSFDGAVVVRGLKADSKGSFTATLAPPAAPAGSHIVQASTSTVTGSAPSEQPFGITPLLALNATTGNIGMALTVSGRGFAPSSPVTILYNNGAARASADTDVNGSFRANFTVPKSLHGDHPFTAQDSAGNEGRTTFTVDATPPSALKPQGPANGSSGALLGGYAPTLKWTPSDDPSGVTYTLQVSSKPDFLDPRLVKADLPSPSYALASEEALPYGTYYWRVKATDAASNEGPWSEVYTVKSRTLPIWMPATVGAVVLGLSTLGFVVVTRRRKAATPAYVPGDFREMPFPSAPGGGLSAPKRAALNMPSRLALPAPAPARKGKAMSLEDMAKYQRAMDFVRSIPLPRVTPDLEWLEEIMNADEAPEDAHEEALAGGITLHYEPAWMRNPAYADLHTALHGQPFLAGLDEYMKAVDDCAGETLALLRAVHQELLATLPPETPREQMWRLSLSVAQDSVSWFQGRFLRDPAARDYVVQPSDEPAGSVALIGADDTPFSGTLAEGLTPESAASYRNIHRQLRAAARRGEQAKELAASIAHAGVLHERLAQAIASLDQAR